MKYTLLMMTFVLSCVSSAAYANGSITGKVAEIRIDSDGKGMVTFVDAIEGARPACAVPLYINSMSFNAATAGGKAIYSMALLAKSSGATVFAQGRGVCEIYGVVEDASVFFLR